MIGLGARTDRESDSNLMQTQPPTCSPLNNTLPSNFTTLTTHLQGGLRHEQVHRNLQPEEQLIWNYQMPGAPQTTNMRGLPVATVRTPPSCHNTKTTRGATSPLVGRYSFRNPGIQLP